MVDHEFLGKFPILHTFLTRSLDDGGKPRKLATLFVFVEDGLWKGCLHERQNSLSLWGAGESFIGVLDCLEGRLAGGRAEWRRDRRTK